MLRLRRCFLAHILSPVSPQCSASASALSNLDGLRLLSAAAPASPNPGFNVVEYLVATCGLTRPQALKASAKLSHLKSPSNPDAVLTFLAGLGVSNADIAAVVAKHPWLLCARVERTLAPKVADLAELGLSRCELARLFPLLASELRRRSVVPKLQYYMSLFGSSEDLYRVIKRGCYVLRSDLERVIKPNVAFLRECGLGTSDVAKLCLHAPRLLNTNTERVRMMVGHAERVGAPRGSGMFRQALHAVAFLSKEKITAQMDKLKQRLRWSDTELAIAVSKGPVLLRMSEDKLQRVSEFLISEVGLEPAYIARRPAIINYSLEGRLRPRYHILRFLTENGLVARDLSYYNVVSVTQKLFIKRFIDPHKEAVPGLEEDYASACRGEVPSRFVFG